MTDLVAQLVGALEETLLFCETFSNRWDGQTGAHPFGMVERARAALSEAKAGGWVAVPEVPTPEMVTQGMEHLFTRRNPRATWEDCIEQMYAAMLAARPLPAPPAQKEPT